MSRVFPTPLAPIGITNACAHRHDGSFVSEFAHDGMNCDELGGPCKGIGAVIELPLTLGLKGSPLPS